ncbi:hypothetical protein R50072_19700 [Simiduia litorea]
MINKASEMLINCAIETELYAVCHIQSNMGNFYYGCIGDLAGKVSPKGSVFKFSALSGRLCRYL